MEKATLPTPPVPGEAGAEDIVRRRYLRQLEDFTDRPVVVYATAFLDAASPKGQSDVQMHTGDKEGFREVTRSLPKGPIDLILHAPGGTAEAAEGILQVLRDRFDDIRVIVPIAAKSAATMLAMAGHSLVLDSTSELGPIDPQRVWRRRVGASEEIVVSPVWAIQEEWKKIDDEIGQNPAAVAKWAPIITQFGPSLLVECEQAVQLSHDLVSKWLAEGMLRTEPDRVASVVDTLADHGRWRSHARAIGPDDIIALGLPVVDLRKPEHAELSERIWHAWHAVSLTIANTGAVKIFENSRGDTMVVTLQLQQVTQRQPVPVGPGRPAGTPTGPLNRQQRRAISGGGRKR